MSEFKNYALGTPVVGLVLFLSDTSWVTEHSDHALQNVSYILSLSYFFNQTSFLPFHNIWILPKISKWLIFHLEKYDFVVYIYFNILSNF